MGFVGKIEDRLVVISDVFVFVVLFMFVGLLVVGWVVVNMLRLNFGVVEEEEYDVKRRRMDMNGGYQMFYRIGVEDIFICKVLVSFDGVGGLGVQNIGNFYFVFGKFFNYVDFVV